MKIKTSELKGTALDYAVAVCEDTIWPVVINAKVFHDTDWDHILYTPASDWSQAGPIIERERMCFGTGLSSYGDIWAKIGVKAYFGDTHLQAAMRCYVASKLGDEVDVPEEVVE